jgi:Rhodopirellula transposase DDE domain
MAGVSRVARSADASRPTVRRGAAELDQPGDPRGRIRRHDGPKRLGERDPGLLRRWTGWSTRHPRRPREPLCWTCKSTRELADALTAWGDLDPHGLRVRAELDRGHYPLGVEVGDEQLAAVPLARHEFHGEWNYTVRPA